MTGEQVVINGRTYTVISRQSFGDTEYVTVEQINGNRKRAQFYQGEFDCWADSGLKKSGNQYRRVNMRGKM
jgi:hypothetical protein